MELVQCFRCRTAVFARLLELVPQLFLPLELFAQIIEGAFGLLVDGASREAFDRLWEIGDAGAVTPRYRAGIRFHVPGDNAHKRGFPASVCAGERYSGFRAQRKPDSVEDGPLTERNRHIGELYEAHSSSPSSASGEPASSSASEPPADSWNEKKITTGERLSR